MRVRSVGIAPTPEQDISLTPELLASTGARYSRNNEGLEAILEKVKGMDQDKAVDTIFKMVDFGHRSISDMAPVAIFMDDISIYMALKIWHLCPTAGGQESSTRYVKLSIDQLTLPPGITEHEKELILKSFKSYEECYELWNELATKHPEVMNLPKHLIESNEEKDKLAINRIKRNFAFDRARYYIPMCCRTNVMMIMQARGWVDLIKYLSSDMLEESKQLAEKLRSELKKVTPRLVKHAVYDEFYANGIKQDFEQGREPNGAKARMFGLQKDSKPFLAIQDVVRKSITDGNIKNNIEKACENHNNRYGYFGERIKRIIVRFGWENLTIAELRDLNRHRTGIKTFSLEPNGMYCSDDEIKKYEQLDPEITSKLEKHKRSAIELMVLGRYKFDMLDPYFVYFLPLGTQCFYEHVTTANNFLYQCELRTGLGAHFTYATRMKEVLELWFETYPETKPYITIGNAEPE